MHSGTFSMKIRWRRIFTHPLAKRMWYQKCCGILKINSYIALLLTILTMRFNVFIASAFMTFIAFIPFIW
jgi:hypothetical protein